MPLPMFCSMIAPNLWLPGSYFSITAVLASYISLTGAEKAVINSVIFLPAITLPPPIWSTGISAGSISSQICSCHSVQHSLAMRSCSVPSGCCFGPSGTGKRMFSPCRHPGRGITYDPYPFLRCHPDLKCLLDVAVPLPVRAA